MEEVKKSSLLDSILEEGKLTSYVLSGTYGLNRLGIYIYTALNIYMKYLRVVYQINSKIIILVYHFN